MTKPPQTLSLALICFFITFFIAFFIAACSSTKTENKAKMSGQKYWTDKAAPGKAYDVQVTDATEVEDGKYRVKALIDGEQRVGIYNPKTENFDEGFYTAAYEKGKKVAELEEEVKYLKGRTEKLEKENYQLKLRLKYVQAGKGDPNALTEKKAEAENKAEVEEKATE